MDKLLAFWLIILFTGTSFWFYLNMNMSIDYKRHPELIDPITKLKRKPSELLNLTKVISYTSQYINSTNALERLYDLEYQLNIENPFITDFNYSNKQDLSISGWPVANQYLCNRHLSWILLQLESSKNYTIQRGQHAYELTKFLDSYGRPESGTYGGIINWLGSYKGCRATSLDGGRIKTRYCIGRMWGKSWPKNESASRPTTIRVGMCLPETCDTNSFETERNALEALIKFELPKLYQDEMTIQSLFCLPDERSPIRRLPQSGQVYLTVLACWLALVIAASIVYELRSAKKKADIKSYEIDQLAETVDRESNSRLNQFRAKFVPHMETEKKGACWSQAVLEALSLRCSIKSFKTNTFQVRYKHGQRVRVDLSGMDVFKIVMCLVIVLAHSGYLVNVYSRSLSNRIEMLVGDLALFAVSLLRLVDVFFLFFGILTSYTLMRKFNAEQLSKPLVWLGVNIGIFLRISPIYMLVYWYSRSVSPYTGSGPWWDYGVDENSMKGVCMRDSWWKSIPYFGSIGEPPVPTCILPAWFLVSYSQISLILPLITYIICKLPGLYKCALILYLCCISAMSTSYRLYMQTTVPSEAFLTYGAFLANLLERFESTGHMATLGRVGCVSVGSLVGYLLYCYDVGKISRWPAWLSKRTTLVGCLLFELVLLFLPVIGKKVSLVSGNVSSMEIVVGVNAFVSIAFPITTSLLVIIATTVYNHKVVMRFFGHNFWHAFNRLGLCIYLVHWEVLFIAMTSFDQAPSYGFITDVLKLWSLGVLVSTVLALAIHLMIEAPLSRLLSAASRIFIEEQNDKRVNLNDFNSPNKLRIGT